MSVKFCLKGVLEFVSCSLRSRLQWKNLQATQVENDTEESCSSPKIFRDNLREQQFVPEVKFELSTSGQNGCNLDFSQHTENPADTP